jgi:hypothetical protein
MILVYTGCYDPVTKNHNHCNTSSFDSLEIRYIPGETIPFQRTLSVDSEQEWRNVNVFISFKNRIDRYWVEPIHLLRNFRLNLPVMERDLKNGLATNEQNQFMEMNFSEDSTDHLIEVKKKPAVFNIDALEDTHVLRISYDDLIDLYTKAPKFDRIFRVLLENHFMKQQERMAQLVSFTAEERYEAFIETYPDLQNRLPQIQIASYIGVTPEFLSRIRSRRSGNNG